MAQAHIFSATDLSSTSGRVAVRYARAVPLVLPENEGTAPMLTLGRWSKATSFMPSEVSPNMDSSKEADASRTIDSPGPISSFRYAVIVNVAVEETEP